jgi:hypothetical protein
MPFYHGEERGEDGRRRRVLVAVAEIVFEIIALGFQGVEAFNGDGSKRQRTLSDIFPFLRPSGR